MHKSKRPVSRPKKIEKRGPGRPRRTPQSGEDLRLKAQQRVREAAEKRNGISTLDVEEFCHMVGGITGKHKFTRQEMDQIRERVDLLYQNYVTDKQITQEEECALYFEAARAARDITGTPTSDKFKPMSKEEWADEHGLRRNLKHRKPGPPKKKRKALWDLSPGEKGLADKPGQYEPFDIAQAEKEYTELKMQEHIEEAEAEAQFIKGKRFRSSKQQAHNRTTPKDFWI